MRKLVLKNDGRLELEDLAFLGGKYSLWERFRKGGIGSTKIIYQTGIDHFDNLKRNVEGELAFVNFELMKNGLILRLNLNQRICCIGTQLSSIKAINLIAYPVEIKRGPTTKIVYQGELEFVEADGTLNFSVIVREFKSIKKYFSKEEFDGKFHYSISSNPPQKDSVYLADIPDLFS